MAGFAGQLEQYGFDEVEPGIVEDTQENRRRVRLLEGEWYYEPVPSEDGSPTGLLKIIDPAQLLDRRKSVHDRRRNILKDPDDPWSDYVGPDDYPLDGDFPYFIRQRLTKWRRDDRYGVPEEERQPFPARCTTFRHDGTRCWNWATQPDRLDRCKNHAGWQAEAQEKAALYAREQILKAAPTFAHGLIELAESATSEPTRLKAITEGLDRIGVRGGTELEIRGEVEVRNPADEVRERLSVIAERFSSVTDDSPPQAELPAGPHSETEIVKAEVVSDTETPDKSEAELPSPQENR